jgi:hypothetical protein
VVVDECVAATGIAESLNRADVGAIYCFAALVQMITESVAIAQAFT